MHAFITHMRAKPGKRDEVIALTTVMLEKTQSEQGVPVYLFHTESDSPDDFWFYDLYESDDARTALPMYRTVCCTLDISMSQLGGSDSIIASPESPTRGRRLFSRPLRVAT